MDGLSEQEIELLLDFRVITETQRTLVCEMLRAMSEMQDPTPVKLQQEE